MTHAKEALERLLEGNARFAETKSTHPRLEPDRRARLLEGQQPFAVILGCSDSRVPPELIFDQGLGDLFVVRTAGHVLGRAVLESVEYAVSHLETALVLVLAITPFVGSARLRSRQHGAAWSMALVVGPAAPKSL